MDTGVLHINIPFFMASVECLLDKSLVGRPVVFASSPSHYTPIVDVSESAYEIGIRRGMTLGEAKRHERDIVVIKPTPQRYLRVVGYIEGIIQKVTPVYEIFSSGEAYLDIKGSKWLFRSEEDIAAQVYESICVDTNLRPRIGIATNKLISRVASSFFYDKAFIKVMAGEEGLFVAPLSINILPDLERWVIEKLADYNVSRVGEINRLGEENLYTLFGKIGRTLELWAKGMDTRVITAQNSPFLREEISISYEENNWENLKRRIFYLASSIGFELRRRRVAAARFKLTVIYTDNLVSEGYVGAKPPLNTDISIFRLLKKLLFRVLSRRVYIKNIVTEATLFSPVFAQQELIDLPSSREFRLSSAIDSIRDRFGERSIYFGIEHPV